jgi:hypothetical protein
MNISNEYIILIWIIGLILFTFYCVFRLKYISDKINNDKINNDKHINNNNNKKDNNLNEKYENIPYLTKPSNIISYINNIQSEDKITDVPGCENVYDDNYKVKGLGYKNCNSAYSDYLKNNYNATIKYDGINSLENVCPVSSKSTKYSECLKTLLNKFTNNAAILENINNDMTDSINKRLENRNSSLYNTKLALNSFINSKEQKDFNNTMLMNNQIPKYDDDKLRLVDNYYQDRYRFGIESFTSQNNNDNNNDNNDNNDNDNDNNDNDNNDNDTIINDKFTNIVHPDIESKYFGNYKPIKGQFLSLDDLIITLEYENLNNNTKNNNVKNKNTEKPVILKINNDDLFIIYKVHKINMYKSKQNAVKLILNDKRIINQNNNNNVYEPLLHILGIYDPSNITIVYDETISTEGITHTTYKLVNDNFDTILVLEKLT